MGNAHATERGGSRTVEGGAGSSATGSCCAQASTGRLVRERLLTSDRWTI